MAVLRKALMLLAALVSYSCGSLLVNWSVIVDEPPPARTLELRMRPRNAEGSDLLGVDMVHGQTTVETVFPAGLAAQGGLLPGDELVLVKQAGRVIFDKTSADPRTNSIEVLTDLEAYLTTPLTDALPAKESHLEIDPDQGIRLVFSLKGIVVTTGDPYCQLTLTLSKSFFGALLMLSYTGLKCPQYYKQLFSLNTFRILVLPALGWSLADACEILAASKINAALYSVLSQTRLVGTAACMYALVGQRQTYQQTSVLCSLSLLIFCYLQIPDYVDTTKYWNGFGKPKSPNEDISESDDPMGIVFAFAKIFLSIVTGVAGQKALQDESLKELPFPVIQAGIWLVSTTVMIPVTVAYMAVTGWDFGFFGGQDVEFRHCNQKWTGWDEAQCASEPPIAIVQQGWDYRTVIVVAFYIYKDFSTSSVLRAFDALVKNLVNASAVVSVYFLSLVIPPCKQFNFAKFGLVLVIVAQIQQYSSLPKPVAPPKPTQGDGDIELNAAVSKS
eukprot:TRINITY_DN22093_c0_g1_i1.p1 TRINITY_DN22093_c0_g1~~TRINITY_DN22093_c0_g1_i1.p1  ORF type:complete len:559 (-),score=69.59 TRINITY_DN22093_c0_g1_i1:199-1701(-)